MTTTTSAPAQVQPEHKLVAALQTAIREYDAADRAYVAAKGKGDKKLAASEASRKATKSAKIGKAMVACADAGVSFEEWTPPKTASHGSRQAAISEADLTASLKKQTARYRDPATSPFMKNATEVAIRGLLRTAERLGYKVESPLAA